MRRPFSGKILLIRRKYVAALALCVAVATIFYIINHPGLVGTTARERFLPIYSIERDDTAMSLTFNVREADCYTAQVAQTLEAYRVRATFFVTGDWVRENRDLAAHLVESGHELMNLSDDHSLLRKLPAAEIQANVLACSDAIQAATGVRPGAFRAPYGAYDDKIVALVGALGMQSVQWSVDSGDWRGLDAAAVARQVQNKAFPGAIILLHSNLYQTALAMPELITGLMEAGYTLVPVSELVYGVENTGSLPG